MLPKDSANRPSVKSPGFAGSIVMLDLLLALLAGIVTIATPCTLPVLPILLGASIGHQETLRPAFISFGFVLSFSAVALILSTVMRIFDFDPNVLREAATVLLAVFGILMIWPAPFQWLSSKLPVLQTTGPNEDHDRQSNLAGFVLGTTLGLVWTPCAGPVLGSILTLIATNPNFGWASVLLVAYTIGAAIPMLLIAYGGQAATTRVRSLARITPQLQRGFGVIVIAFAIASYLQYDTIVVAWLTSFYPSTQIGL